MDEIGLCGDCNDYCYSWDNIHLNVDIPFEPGDIVTVDSIPFAKPQNIVLLEVGSDCCGVQALYRNEAGEWDTGAVKHGTIYPEVMAMISPLYRMRKHTGPLEDSEKQLEAASHKIKKGVEMENESLAQGVFWIIDIDELNNNKKYCFSIQCDADGNIINKSIYNLNAKSGATYNHELLWRELPKADTFGKAFDYYPRGRVQINNKKATVYLNPNINTDEIKKYIIEEFGLYEKNGLKSIRFISDGSAHYKCYLDEKK